jgi:hypothetical protein
MTQRQLRLGDILDDYCPRERRLTNHVVVAMIGADVKQTRCSTCEAEHEYKQARLPRLRRKADAPAALSSPTGGPKLREPAAPAGGPLVSPLTDVPEGEAPGSGRAEAEEAQPVGRAAGESDTLHGADQPDNADEVDGEDRDDKARDEGPVHRPLIRASLPRLEGQPPPQRPATDFTIRQPAGRQNRFRPRHAGGGQQSQGNRSGGHMGSGGPQRGGMSRHGSGHSPGNRPANRHGHGRKRSK